MKLKELFGQLSKKDGIICAALAVVILIVSVVTFTDRKENVTGAVSEKVIIEEKADTFEARLENILSKIEGVGKVDVLISYEDGEGASKPVAAVVIAEGADMPEARIKLQLAVETSLGLPASRIKIFTMGGILAGQAE